MINIQAVFDEAQAYASTHSQFCFEKAYPYLDMLPYNFSILTPDSRIMNANRFCLDYLRIEKMADVYQRRIDEVASWLNWPKLLGETCLKNDEIAIKNGALTINEFGLLDNKLAKWLSKKQAIYNADGQVIAILCLAILAETEVSGLFVNEATQMVTIYLDNVNTIRLTPREFLITRALLQGYSALEIGLKLHSSPKTIEAHIANVKNKFNCDKKSHLIAHLIDLGIARELLRSEQ